MWVKPKNFVSKCTSFVTDMKLLQIMPHILKHVIQQALAVFHETPHFFQTLYLYFLTFSREISISINWLDHLSVVSLSQNTFGVFLVGQGDRFCVLLPLITFRNRHNSFHLLIEFYCICHIPSTIQEKCRLRWHVRLRDRRLPPRLNRIFPILTLFSEFFRLLCYYAVWGGLKPTFRDYLSVRSLKVKLWTAWPLNIGPIGSP